MTIEDAHIGVDVIQVSRFRNRPVTTHRKFYDTIFNESEIKYCLKYSDPYPHLAGLFAAKEAIIKCIDFPIRMTEIEIGRSKEGRPTANIHREGTFEIRLSISHTQSLAIAVGLFLH